jgi:hypothetical protein
VQQQQQLFSAPQHYTPLRLPLRLNIIPRFLPELPCLSAHFVFSPFFLLRSYILVGKLTLLLPFLYYRI